MKKSDLRNIIREEITLVLEDAKDDMRINDIVKKAAGDELAMVKLAQNMANKITDGLKAVRRAEAAERIIPQSSVASIFKDRAKQLGMDVDTKNQPAPTSPGSSSQGYIYLPTVSAMTLWEYEITGQLSDGMWENSTPHDHYKFWTDLEVKRGTPEVKGGGWARKTGYNLQALVPIVGDRMISMGRMAKALGRKLTYKEAQAAEDLPQTESIRPMKLQGLKKSDIDAFYKTQYGSRELNNDLSYIKKAMSTART